MGRPPSGEEQEWEMRLPERDERSPPGKDQMSYETIEVNQALCLQTDDFREGVRAFLQKRAPSYTEG